MSLLFISLTGFAAVQRLMPASTTVTVEAEGRIVYRLSLLKDQRVKVKGPLGYTIVEIKDQKVRVVDSPCPKKYCVLQGWKDRGAIVCLPNRVVVTIGGKDDSQIDAITG
ncbi:MAG: NusG domain II-containing protein [Nitrospirae bacterium]|nr:NusG domain II-containing protein [Nitrospirota bacterium]